MAMGTMATENQVVLGQQTAGADGHGLLTDA